MAKHLYAAYFTGQGGRSLGMFLIGDGIVSGVDEGGVKYDGTAIEDPDGNLVGVVQFDVPAGVTLITGLTTETVQKIQTPIKLPRNFADGITVVRIDTPAGPVNARFERLRENV